MRKYPIQYRDNTEFIPYDMMLEHEEQCLRNHGQNVEKLAKRCGTSYTETLFIIKDTLPNGYQYLNDKFGSQKEVERQARKVVLSISYQWLMKNGLLN